MPTLQPGMGAVWVWYIHRTTTSGFKCFTNWVYNALSYCTAAIVLVVHLAAAQIRPSLESPLREHHSLILERRMCWSSIADGLEAWQRFALAAT